MPLMPKAPGAGGKGQRTPSLCHSPACSLPAPPCPACTFLHCPATDPAKPSPDLSPLIPPGSCFPHNSGLQAGGGEELPAQIRIPYLGRAGGEAENPHNTDANNCKKQQGNGQDDPEGPGGSWEVCCGPLVLGARAKEGGTGVKIDHSADSSSSNVFPAHETNPCANWLVCRAAKPLQHLE